MVKTDVEFATIYASLQHRLGPGGCDIPEWGPAQVGSPINDMESAGKLDSSATDATNDDDVGKYSGVSFSSGQSTSSKGGSMNSISSASADVN